MDSIKPISPTSKTNLSKTFHDHSYNEVSMARNRVLMESFAAKLFSIISAVKAAYAELQAAQFPYNSELIQSADAAIVQELKMISKLKQSYLKNKIDPISIVLAEMQEQQSMIKMYELAIKKLQLETANKNDQILLLKRELTEIVSDKRFSILDGIKLPNSNPNDFVTVLQYAVRSVKTFVKKMVQHMESANWNIGSAAKSIVAGVNFHKPNHHCFAFESFICKEMLDCFNSNSNFNFKPICCEEQQYMILKSGGNPVQFLNQNPNSSFAKFTREKYLHLIHPKMEASFFGNLNQRKLINSGEYPETAFFVSFAEMARRVWILYCFGLFLDQEICIFQVENGSRFSEMYMDSVTDDSGGNWVAFMVVPGFKVGEIMIQSQVYVSHGSFHG